MDFIIRLGDALVLVVWAMVLAYIIMSMLPIPYSRTSSAIRNFLDQTVGPGPRVLPPVHPAARADRPVADDRCCSA